MHRLTGIHSTLSLTLAAACVADRADGLDGGPALGDTEAHDTGTLDPDGTDDATDEEEDDNGTEDGGDEEGTAGDTTGDTGGPPAGACPSNGGGGPTGEHSLQTGSTPSAMIYVPSSYHDDTPMPLVVSFHGAGDNAQNFNEWWKDVADAEGILVLTPESTTGPGASWDPQNDDAVVDALVVEMESQYNVDTCRRYAAGFSNGAHYAYMVGLANAEAFAGIGVMAGSLQWAQSAGIWPDAVERPVAVAIHHGTDDPVIPFSHGTASRDALENRGHTVYFTPLDGVAHTIKKTYAAQMWADLRNHASNE